ncbi:MAG: HAMP domain-containing sensor histidine kinase [Halioglobus sp.]
MVDRPAILTKPAAHVGTQQNVALFRIYVVYRALLGVVLLIMLISPNTRQLVGSLNPTLYVSVALLYLGTSVALAGSLVSRRHQSQTLLFGVFLIDIAAITTLTDTSGGMASGLPVLLIITVAASAVLITARTIATLVAAMSVLAILLDTLRLVSIGEASFNALFPAGILGILIFGVSLMVQAISIRLGNAEELARNRASDLYNLQRLNEQIVQHMQTGILLVGEDGLVRVINKSASSLLAPERPLTVEQGRQLADYSSDLAYQYAHWRDSGLHRAKPFTVMDGAPEVIAHFRDLQPSEAREALIFVEDYTPVTQYAQSLKLSSLGRLTASIAHEIRNPLGAMSHAAQLLIESPDLKEADRRMAEIMIENSERVNNIIESVMQISRREAPKPEYLLLSQWLEDWASNYLSNLNRPVEITISCDFKELLVEFDPENLQRVMTNLVDNAIRHSQITSGAERARIHVSLDHVSHQCFIEVIDEGTGVSPVDLPKLFEPFFTTVEEGSGMGLFLCKELCEINGAHLSYRPTSKGESCFRIAVSQRAL